MKNLGSIAVVCLTLVNAIACGVDNTTQDNRPEGQEVLADTQNADQAVFKEEVAALPEAPACDVSLRPIVFVHGFLAS